VKRDEKLPKTSSELKQFLTDLMTAALTFIDVLKDERPSGLPSAKQKRTIDKKNR
jgi:hypothetical protein